MCPPMLKRLGFLSLVFLSPVPAIVAQVLPLKPDTPKADQSQEAFVIEQLFRKERLENDGTSSKEDLARVRIQTEAGVQQYDLLTFSYERGPGTWGVQSVPLREPGDARMQQPA